MRSSRNIRPPLLALQEGREGDEENDIGRRYRRLSVPECRYPYRGRQRSAGVHSHDARGSRATRGRRRHKRQKKRRRWTTSARTGQTAGQFRMSRMPGNRGPHVIGMRKDLGAGAQENARGQYINAHRNRREARSRSPGASLLRSPAGNSHVARIARPRTGDDRQAVGVDHLVRRRARRDKIAGRDGENDLAEGREDEQGGRCRAGRVR